MRYPSLTEKATASLVVELLAGSNTEVVDREKRMIGNVDQELDLTEISQLSRELKAELETIDDSVPRDSFEGAIAGRIHEALKPIDIQILDDKGFWRYLALRHFWWLAVWREDAFAKGDPGKYLKYVNAMNSTECVLTRTFLRGQIALEAGGYELAEAVEQATDFWRSHISRVNNWKYPTLVRAFIRSHTEDRMLTDPLRSFARALNRRRSNFWLRDHSDEEAEKIVADLRDKIDGA